MRRRTAGILAVILLLAGGAAGGWKLRSEKEQESEIGRILKRAEEMKKFPEHASIAYLGAELTGEGAVRNFTMTVETFDEKRNYLSSLVYTYDGGTGGISVRTYKETDREVVYDPNALPADVEEALRKIPAGEQTARLGASSYRLEFRPDTWLPEGEPAVDGRDGRKIPVLSYEAYRQGKAGISDGAPAVVISIRDAETGRKLNYCFQPADEEAMKEERATGGETDCRMEGGTLRLTCDAGETWVDTGLSERQVAETRELCGGDALLPDGSFYADAGGTYAVFYGEEPVLRLSGDGGRSWEDTAFTGPAAGNASRRIVRFLDAQNGYAALGTEGDADTEPSTYLYWTYDGGATWSASPVFTEEECVLSGLAFADLQNGVISMLAADGSEQWPVLKVTEDGGLTFQEVLLPRDSIPEEAGGLESVDSLTAERGVYVLTLGQGSEGDTKAVYESADMTGEWKFQECYEKE